MDHAPIEIATGTTLFTSMIGDITNLRGKGDRGGSEHIRFSYKRSNGVLSLQWEPFDGYVVAKGTLYLGVIQGIAPKPCYHLQFPVPMLYGGQKVMGTVHVDPNGERNDVYFELPYRTTGQNEHLEVFGSCIQWHTGHGR